MKYILISTAIFFLSDMVFNLGFQQHLMLSVPFFIVILSLFDFFRKKKSIYWAVGIELIMILLLFLLLQ
jgi:uncharacterized membrane protein